MKMWNIAHLRIDMHLISECVHHINKRRKRGEKKICVCWDRCYNQNSNLTSKLTLLFTHS